MDSETLFGPAAQQKRILGLLRDIASRAGVAEPDALVPDALVPDAQMTGEMKNHISQCFRQLGATTVFASTRDDDAKKLSA